MWIKCSDGELLNSDHVRGFKAGEASQVMPTSHLDGTKIVRQGFPSDGWLLVAQLHCPRCIARYETFQEADAALNQLYEAMNTGTATLDLS